MVGGPASPFLPAVDIQPKAFGSKWAETVDNYTKRRYEWQNGAMPRFLTLADVAEQLQINSPQAYALVRSGELKAIQVGGRGQWRIEETMLEQYIQDRYAEASRMIEAAKSKSGQAGGRST
ncbi:excisionase family DNA binding protein [Paenarthrobacter histidinolovorans]|uniref:Excisionase family DNA binding protein n=2 Tax=Paenarthrobacter histidinolovorans TaxID=43664 RepID=A0ABW8N4W7_9MICC